MSEAASNTQASLLLPASMQTMMWDYQKEVVQRLQAGYIEKGQQGMLCCEKMGAGKTLEALATTIGISESEQHAKTDMKLKLVVGPTSAIEAWRRDCDAHFSPPIHTLVVGGCAGESFTVNSLRTDTIVLVNFSTFIRAYKDALARRKQATNNLMSITSIKYLPSDQRVTWARTYMQHLTTTSSLWVPTDANYSEFIAEELLAHEADLVDFHSTLLDDHLFSIEWEWMVVDEVHEARNHTGCTFAALQSALTHRRLALSATPYNNRISDFMSILEILHASPAGGWAAIFDRGWDVEQLLEFLNQRKRDVMVASEYSHVEKMYARFNTLRVTLCVPFSTRDEHEAYQQMHTMYQQHQQAGGRTVIFEAISELRKLCDGATKIRVACKYASEVLTRYREKAVFFVWHVQLCKQMAERLRAEADPRARLLVEEITGSVTPAVRIKTLERLRRHEGPAVLVTTIQAMSLGVNMPFLHHAVVFTTWWNPMVVAQAKDRIRRPQQKRSPRIVEVIIDGTVEKTIDLVSYFKWKFNRQLVYGEITRKMLVPITSKKAMERRISQMSSEAHGSQRAPPALDDSEGQIIQGITGMKKRGRKKKSRPEDEKGGDAMFQHMVFDAGSGGSGQRGLLEMIDFFFSSSHFDGAGEADEASIRRRIWDERCDVLIEDLSQPLSEHIPPTTPLEGVTEEAPTCSSRGLVVLEHKKELTRKRIRDDGEARLANCRLERTEREEISAKRQMCIKERRAVFGTSRAVEMHYAGMSDLQRAALARRTPSSVPTAPRQIIRIPIEAVISR